MAELEVERAFWKNAHVTALDNAERDAKVHNAQVVSLNRQLSSLESFRVSPHYFIEFERFFIERRLKNQDPLIFCIVDNIFAIDLIRLGAQGGRQAAQNLTKAIAESVYSIPSPSPI